MKYKSNICVFLAFLILVFSFFLNIPKGSGSYPKEVKRGYILDRSGEPLVINKEKFQAYWIVRGKSFLGEDIPKELRTYLPLYLELPKRGLVLISENLNFEEAQKLKEVKNVIIKKEIKRVSLFTELKPFIGVSSGSEGISGVEKAFNQKLKEGNTLTLALDLNLCKKIYNYAKHYAPTLPQSLAIFKKDTGEMIAFFSRDDKNFLLERFSISKDNLPLPIEEVNWELETPKVKTSGAFITITPIHLVKAYLKDYCGAPLSPTLLPKKEIPCKKKNPSQDPLFLYLPHKKQWLSFLHRENYLYVLSGTFSEDFKEEAFFWDKFKKNLTYLISLF